MSAESRLKELGITLPEMPSPEGNSVPGLVHNAILHLSGQGPLCDTGEFPCGIVGMGTLPVRISVEIAATMAVGP